MNYLIKSFSNYLLNEKINDIIKKEKNVVYHYMDDLKVEELINECMHMSLFDDKKVVIVFNFTLKSINNKLLEYFKNPNKNTTLILITSKVDKRTKIYKEIKDIIEYIDICIPYPDSRKKDVENYKIKLLQNYCTTKNIKIDNEVIKILISNNLNNIDLVISEINKLSIISNDITLDDINDYGHIMKETDSFYLLELILTKNKKEFLKEFKIIETQKEEIYSFTALLASQLRIMYYTYIIDGSATEISKRLNVHSFRVERSKYFNTYFTKNEVEIFVKKLSEFDYKIKTTSLNEYILFKKLIVTL